MQEQPWHIGKYFDKVITWRPGALLGDTFVERTQDYEDTMENVAGGSTAMVPEVNTTALVTIVICVAALLGLGIVTAALIFIRRK